MIDQDDEPLYTVKVTPADLTVEGYSFEAMLDILEQNARNITLHVSNTRPKSTDETHVFSNLKIDFCDQEEEEVMLHDGYTDTTAIYFNARHSVFLKVDDKFKILSFVREEHDDYLQCYKQAIEFDA